MEINHLLATVENTSPHIASECLVEPLTEINSPINPDKCQPVTKSHKKKHKEKKCFFKSDQSSSKMKRKLSNTRHMLEAEEAIISVQDKLIIGNSFDKLKKSVIKLTNCNDETDKNLTIILDKAKNLVLEVSNVPENKESFNQNSKASSNNSMSNTYAKSNRTVHKPNSNAIVIKKKKFFFGSKEAKSGKDMMHSTCNSNSTSLNSRSKKPKSKFKSKYFNNESPVISKKISILTENLANNQNSHNENAAKSKFGKNQDNAKQSSSNIKISENTTDCSKTSIRTKHSNLEPNLIMESHPPLKKTKNKFKGNISSKNNYALSEPCTFVEKNIKEKPFQNISADNGSGRSPESTHELSLQVKVNKNVKDVIIGEKKIIKKKFKAASYISKQADNKVMQATSESVSQDIVDTPKCKSSSSTKEFSRNLADAKLHKYLRCHVSLTRLSTNQEINENTVISPEKLSNDAIDISDLPPADYKDSTSTVQLSTVPVLEERVDKNANTLTLSVSQQLVDVSLTEGNNIKTDLKAVGEPLVHIPDDRCKLRSSFDSAIENLLSDLESCKGETPELTYNKQMEETLGSTDEVKADISNEHAPLMESTSEILNNNAPTQTSVEGKLDAPNDYLSLPSCTEEALSNTNGKDHVTFAEPNVSTNVMKICAQEIVTAPSVTTDIPEDTHISKSSVEPADTAVRRRNQNVNIKSVEGEISEKCCGHFFPSNNSYVKHLMSTMDENINIREMHEALLSQLDMVKCRECKKWLKTSSLRKHLRRVHHIKPTVLLALTSKTKNKSAVTTPVIQSVCSLKSDMEAEESAPCPLSKKKDVTITPPMILCHLTGDKSLSVSCVSDLPFSMKPIVMLEKSLSPYKRKMGFKSVPRIVKVESLSTKRSMDDMNDDVMGKLTFPKADGSNAPTKMKKKKSIGSPPKAATNRAEANLATASICITKPNGKLRNEGKFCYAESIKKKIQPLSEKNRCSITGLKGKGVTKKNGKLKKKFQPVNGYFLQDSSDDSSSVTSSADESSDEDINKENHDCVPTVELDLFTMPTDEDKDSSVFLTDPANPDFKVFANMDAIFVGDAELVQPSSQIGYVTDTNNVVYINPEHFLFPNLDEKDLDLAKLSGDLDLDSLKLSAKDLEILSSNFDPKKNSPVKASWKNESPLKNDLTRKSIRATLKNRLASAVIVSPRKKNCVQKEDQPPSTQHNRDTNRTSPAKSAMDKHKSPLKLTVLKNMSFALKQPVSKAQKIFDLKNGQMTVTKRSVDPIKKALGLVNKKGPKKSLAQDKINNSHSKVRIGDSNDDSQSAFEEFFISSDDISIVENEDGGLDEDDEPVCLIPDILSDKECMNSANMQQINSHNSIKPIVIRVGKSRPVSVNATNSDRKYIIIVHNSLTKSLLKQFPRYWGSRNITRKYCNSRAKSNFNIARSTESYQSQFAKVATQSDDYRAGPGHKRNISTASTFMHPKHVKVVSPKKTRKTSYLEPDPIPNDLLGSLVDTINIDPDSDIIDLPITLLQNESLSDLKSYDATEVMVQPSDSLPAPVNNVSLETPTKAAADEYVYLDDDGILRSPSGRDLNRTKTELDEEALLIGMIENYAQNLMIPSSPPSATVMEDNFDPKSQPQSPPAIPIPVSDSIPEKYMDVLKGRSAWDTQLLFSPTKNSVRHSSSTDTASDNDRAIGASPRHRNRLKRKQSDVDLSNIPFAEIPDLLSPVIQNSQNSFLLSSPVALSPNTLSAVLSPQGYRTPTAQYPSPEMIRPTNTLSVFKRSTKNTPSSSKRSTKNTPSSSKRPTQNTPSSSKKSTKNTPSSSKRSTKNTPNSSKRTIKNTPSSSKITTKSVPAVAEEKSSRKLFYSPTNMKKKKLTKSKQKRFRPKKEKLFSPKQDSNERNNSIPVLQIKNGTKRKRRSKKKPKETFVETGTALFPQSIRDINDEADFSGFDDEETLLFQNSLNNVFFQTPKVATPPKKVKQKCVNLKISFRNPNNPVVLPRTPSTSDGSDRDCQSEPKRRRFSDSDSDLPIMATAIYSSSSEDEQPLQAIVLKNFRQSPGSGGLSRLKAYHDSGRGKYVESRPQSRIQVRPLQDLRDNTAAAAVRTKLCTFTTSGTKISDGLAPPVTAAIISPELTYPVGPYSRTKLKPIRKKSPPKKHTAPDIRSYFSSSTPPPPKSGSDPENTFEGFVSELSGNEVKPKPAKRRRFIPSKQKSSGDIRHYLSVEQTPASRALPLFSSKERADHLQKLYDNLEKLQQASQTVNTALHFVGFENSFAAGEAKLTTLRTYVDVLNMQNMFCTNDYSLQLDSTCDWDERTINHELELF